VPHLPHLSRFTLHRTELLRGCKKKWLFAVRHVQRVCTELQQLSADERAVGAEDWANLFYDAIR
jgi:hypothetical protein